MGPPDIVVDFIIVLSNTPYCTVHVTVNGIMRACACTGAGGGASGVGAGGGGGVEIGGCGVGVGAGLRNGCNSGGVGHGIWLLLCFEIVNDGHTNQLQTEHPPRLSASS